MALAIFPEGVSKGFPPEESPNPIGDLIGPEIRRISALFGANEEERKEPPDAF